MAAHLLERGIEVVDLVQRADLGLVGEEHVDLVGDEITELLPVPVHTERVGQGERDLAVRAACGGRRLPDGVLRRRLVPEVSLEVGHRGAGDEGGVDVVGTDERRRPEVRALRALRVRCHHHEATARRRSGSGGCDVEVHAERSEIVRVDLAELVVTDAPDERDRGAEGRQAGDRVGARPPGDLLRGRKVGVDRFRPLEVHHRGRAAREIVGGDELLVDGADHVDERVADAEDGEVRVAHRPAAGAVCTNATGAPVSLPFPCGSSGGRRRRPIVWVRP